MPLHFLVKTCWLMAAVGVLRSYWAKSSLLSGPLMFTSKQAIHSQHKCIFHLLLGNASPSSILSTLLSLNRLGSCKFPINSAILSLLKVAGQWFHTWPLLESYYKIRVFEGWVKFYISMKLLYWICTELLLFIERNMRVIIFKIQSQFNVKLVNPQRNS